jgi:hypothetical protein
MNNADPSPKPPHWTDAQERAYQALAEREGSGVTAPTPAGPSAGWYPDAKLADTVRYWDGGQWTDNVAPASGKVSSQPASVRQSQSVIALVLAGSVVGLVMALQSASLLTGTGTLWTGVAIASGAGMASWVMRHSLPTVVRGVAIIVAAVALANVMWVESQLDDKRQEISNLFP